jgi:hypothetical protein
MPPADPWPSPAMHPFGTLKLPNRSTHVVQRKPGADALEHFSVPC